MWGFYIVPTPQLSQNNPPGLLPHSSPRPPPGGRWERGKTHMILPLAA